MKKFFQLMLMIAMIAACAYVSVSFVWFQHGLSDTLFEENKDRLLKTNEQSIHFVKQTLQDFESQLQLIADFSTLYHENDREAVVMMLEEMNAKNKAIDYALFDLDGVVYTTTEVQLDMDWEKVLSYLEEKRGLYISEARHLQNRDEIVLALPVIVDGKVQGGVLGVYQSDYLTSIFSEAFYSGIGATLIVQKDGALVSGYQGMAVRSDFFKEMQKFTYPNKAYDQNTMKTDIKQNKSGFVVFEKDQTRHYLSYAPIGIKDWIVVNIVNAEALSPHYFQIMERSILLSVSYAFIFLGILCMLFYIVRKMKKAEEEHVSARRFEMLASLQKSAIIFEYDCKRHYLHVSDNYEYCFGISSTIAKDIHEALKTIVDLENIQRMKEQIQKEGRIQLQLQLWDREHCAHWFEVEGGIIYDQRKQPASLIGFIYDIHSSYIEKERLQIQVNTDQLTHTFAKAEIMRQIEDTLINFSASKHALLFIDLDNFKQVNDTFGHIAGDEVLANLGNVLNEELEGIAGRFGGDEFVLFIKNIEEGIDVKDLASRLLKKVEGLMAYPIGISIGVSIYGEDAHNLDELLLHADQALYASKHKGKGVCIVYGEDKSSHI
ncbi:MULTISPECIES: sensor domain-containing diguanylate cyclase [Bacillota]|jgi:diguanylate cyclase (GGDEF)-like protein|uniref:Sensor domain-containing diguanylate cyclase n=1 Tax=Amedibacillus hominis TaxID=2897776 RepID=A0ABS9R986_9FIRM|nr:MULTISPECIES: sensor domain-containing diguanylate cyclase [Bacillota]MCH4286217.1 sensor domain-containing diguanylate cyclase [Amedibacillus hominis]RGB53285.1 GGDEF domain-containing protein [Absiella sp. AM22-9]RGB55971.1 GGDEF domain-containing protein [Absiella sp. AM10-20]RGB67351.1 GGDEF domain-containing protein [Absiella sp. AM09-45]RGB76964.1 GGDEF domain-containing protein [Absiella sp. AM09-50]